MKGVIRMLEQANSFDIFLKKLDLRRKHYEASNAQKIYARQEERKDYECKKCKDEGRYLVYQDGEPRAEICACMKAKSIIRRFRECQIPENMRDARFGNLNFDYYSQDLIPGFEDQITYRERAKFVASFCHFLATEITQGRERKGVYLHGPVGSGKTRIACCMANYMMSKRDDIKVLFVGVSGLLKKIRSTMTDKAIGTESEYELIQKISGFPFLVLDDLGAHNYTEWTLNTIYSILEHRLEKKLPTIITSNLDYIGLRDEKGRIQSQLMAAVGSRVASRIPELCYPIYLPIKGEDIRQQQLYNETSEINKRFAEYRRKIAGQR